MATETLRANGLVLTSGTGTLTSAGLAYDADYFTYASCAAQSVGSGAVSAVFTASWAAKTRTWSSYKIRLFFKNWIDLISGFGGSVLVEYATDGSTYTTASLDELVTADYSFTPLEISKSGDVSLTNLKIRITATSNRSENLGEWGDGIVCSPYELEVVGTYTPVPPAPAFLMNFL